MRVSRRVGAGAVAVGLVLGVVQAAGAAPVPTAGTRLGTVTLITGDQVVLLGGNTVSVRPGDGRKGVIFSTHTVDGHTYVIPSDAQRLVNTGRLDRRLFDVTTLTEFGYDDAHRDSVPVIVTHPEGRAAPRAARVSRELPSINGVAIAADKSGATWEALTDGGATRTAASGVSKVWLDGRRRATLDRSAAQIGAPTAWARGITGAGVTVAVLDSGVDQTHPDLAGREIAERNFSDTPDNTDNFGHGTHVASIVAGTGAKSGGRYRGIADDAAILDGKVLNDEGYGMDSGIIAGMEWAAQQGADIANLSLGGPDTPETDPLEQAVESLSAQYGILFVVAAGNSLEAGAYSVSSPGSAPSALTVGAVDRNNALAPFSNRGPAGDGAVKPDLTAPGVGIVAALHAGRAIGDPVEDGYTVLSGTSMAAPHVAGAAALLAQRHPGWTGQQLKTALTGSAAPTSNVSAYDQGAGRVDVARALDQTVVSEQASISFGTAVWPHGDDVPVTRTLTYRNLGTADVTLDLALDTGAPAGTFSLSADEVTVPAGGTAAVTVTGDPRAGSTDGPLSGVVVARAGDSVTRTPVGLVREPESYDLTLNYLDDQGRPTARYDAWLAGLDDNRVAFPYDEDGSVTLRLPKGRYAIQHTILTEGDTHANAFLQPGIALDHDLTVDIDARDTRPIHVTPPGPAAFEFGDITYAVTTDGWSVGGNVIFTHPGAVTTAQLGDALPGTTTRSLLSTSWQGDDEVGYGLVWSLPEFPTGFTKAVRWRDLAAVHMDVGPGGQGLPAAPMMIAYATSGDRVAGTTGHEMSVPGTRDVYITTEGLRWSASLLQVDADHDIVAELEGPARTYRAGHAYSVRINHPMFGPGVPDVARRVDDLYVGLPLFSDGDGNTGLSASESAVTRLYAGDRLVGETPYVGGLFTDLPPEAGSYRLTVEATRDPVYTLSTAISAEWTFTSSHAGPDWEPQNLDVVRFTPKLDAHGSAPAGKRFLVPLRVLDGTGAASRPTHLSVEVSYDEGKSWQPARVTAQQAVVLQHPATATSVSLRASATDHKGNTVKETVIRAYTLS